jgi:hypothetical protein
MAAESSVGVGRVLRVQDLLHEVQLTLAGRALGHDSGERHRPEHFERGVADMNLVDLLEMLAAWKAAMVEHGGDLGALIAASAERYGYGPELERLLRVTARDMGWL